MTRLLRSSIERSRARSWGRRHHASTEAPAHTLIAAASAAASSLTPLRTEGQHLWRVGRGQITVLADHVESVANRADGFLLTLITALCAFGLVMVYSASEALGYICCRNANYFFERQAAALIIGIVGMVLASRFDYHNWRRLTKPLVLGTLALLLLVLVPYIGVNRNGARRWFVLGPISLQPSSVAAVVAIVAFAHWLSQRGPQIQNWRTVRDYSVLVGVLLGLIMLEKDLGTTIVAGSVALVVLALAGARRRHLLALVGIAGIAGWMMIQVEAYRAARLTSFANPFADPLNAGYQSVQALYALGSGGLTGVGLGNSIQKYNWLPEAQSDFIFAIIGEELGLIGTLCVVTAFLLLAWRGLRCALRAPDQYGALLAGGITAWIAIQAFVNMAAVTNVIPTTGITLPFISYGGTSLAMTLTAMGILCNVSTQGRKQGDLQRAHVDSRWGNGRSSDTRTRRRAGVAGAPS